MPATAADVVQVIFTALSIEEQEEIYARPTELRVRRLAGEESTAARMIRSLHRVAEHVGRIPTVDD